MSLVNILNIIVENNPSNFLSPFLFKVTFECLQPIKEEIEWKLIYVGSAKDESYDQILDSFSMDSLQAGVMQFQLESSAPNYQLIPTKDDLFGVTAIIIAISFRKQEFFRCGYYVYNNYIDEELLMNDPPQVLIDRIQRSILADKPRITRYMIDWGLNDEAEKALYLGGEQSMNKPNVLSDTTNLMSDPNYGSEMRKFMGDVKTSFIDNNSYNPFNTSNGIFNELNNVPSLNDCFGNSGWNGGMSNNMNTGFF